VTGNETASLPGAEEAVVIKDKPRSTSQVPREFRSFQYFLQLSAIWAGFFKGHMSQEYWANVLNISGHLTLMDSLWGITKKRGCIYGLEKLKNTPKHRSAQK
jgi:hypothetical protein